MLEAVEVRLHQQELVAAAAAGLGRLQRQGRPALQIQVAVAVGHFLPEALLAALAAPASSSSRSTNKDIHAKQSLSILWN